VKNFNYFKAIHPLCVSDTHTHTHTHTQACNLHTQHIFSVGTNTEKTYFAVHRLLFGCILISETQAE